MTTLKQDIFHVLAQITDLVPEVRLGQLLANLSYLARGPTNESIWDMEDQELLETARQHLSSLQQRTELLEKT